MYMVDRQYTDSLKVTNASGDDKENKNDYIIVESQFVPTDYFFLPFVQGTK